MLFSLEETFREFSTVVNQGRVLHNFQWRLQMFLASKLWKLIYYYILVSEVFYTVNFSNDVIQNKKKKHEYRDILNLVIYKLNSSNPFSLQHALFSLQVERWTCRKWVLYRVTIWFFQRDDEISDVIKLVLSKKFSLTFLLFSVL